MSDAITNLRTLLAGMGGVPTKQVKDGAFEEVSYVVGGLLVQLLSDYGTWRANLAYLEGVLFPASFWLAALDGSASPPEPAVTPEDLDRLEARLSEVVGTAHHLAPAVEAMGVSYRLSMKDRFG